MDNREKELRARLATLESEVAKDTKEKIKAENELEYRKAMEALDCKNIKIGTCFRHNDDFLCEKVIYVRIIGIDTEANEAKKKEITSEYKKHNNKLPNYCNINPRIIVEVVEDTLWARTLNRDELPPETIFIQKDEYYNPEWLYRQYTKISSKEYKKKRQEILDKNMAKFFND